MQIRRAQNPIMRELLVMRVLMAIFLVLLSTSPLHAHASDKTKGQRVDTSIITKMKRIGNREYAVGEIVLDAKPIQVWNVLTDYEHSPEVFKNLKSCSVVGNRGNRRLIRQVVEPIGFMKFDYIVAMLEKKPTNLSWYKDSGSLKELTGEWNLKPLAGGNKTGVTYQVFIDGGVLLPSWILTNKAKGHLPVVLTALKQKVHEHNLINLESD